MYVLQKIANSRGPLILYTLFVLYILLPTLTFAADTDSLDIASNATEDPALLATNPIPGVTSCFDYYRFNSVHANLTPTLGSTVSGGKITFAGSLINENPYPIVDGTFFVKVFKKRTTPDGNGHDVVDAFVVRHGISLNASSSSPLTFTWNVPTNAASGEYEIATFFTTSRKFNLLGLTFTDDVVGDRIPFTVSSERNDSLSFEKNSVTINGNPYIFGAFPPDVADSAPAHIQATISNTTTNDQQATIQWTVYHWDAQLRENVVAEYSESVNVPARGTYDTSYAVTDSHYPVYYVVGHLTWGDSKSILGIRFVRPENDRVRINFPGITSFPLVKGKETTLFSCLHNSGQSAFVGDSILTLTLTDASNNEIAAYRYSGDITSTMMGVKKDFVPRKNYDYLRLDARLYHNGEFVDEVSLVYNCKDLDPTSCFPPPASLSFDSITSFAESRTSGITILLSLLAALVTLGILAGVVLIIRK